MIINMYFVNHNYLYFYKANSIIKNYFDIAEMEAQNLSKPFSEIGDIIS